MQPEKEVQILDQFVTLWLQRASRREEFSTKAVMQVLDYETQQKLKSNNNAGIVKSIIDNPLPPSAYTHGIDIVPATVFQAEYQLWQIKALLERPVENIDQQINILSHLIDNARQVIEKRALNLNDRTWEEYIAAHTIHTNRLEQLKSRYISPTEPSAPPQERQTALITHIGGKEIDVGSGAGQVFDNEGKRVRYYSDPNGKTYIEV